LPSFAAHGSLGSDWLADRLVVIAQLAEELDRSTLAVALWIVPVEWWKNRLQLTAASAPK